MNEPHQNTKTKVSMETLKKAIANRQYFPETKLHSYVVHNESEIKGFFGPYRFLSNFQLCPNGIWYEGLKFPSTEHAYQAAKVPMDERDPFISCNCRDVKRLGGVVEVSKEVWDAKKYNVMSQLVLQKFATDEELRDKLIATGNAYLEETNHWQDKTWGVCNGVGTNWLGKILMSVRGFWMS